MKNGVEDMIVLVNNVVRYNVIKCYPILKKNHHWLIIIARHSFDKIENMTRADKHIKNGRDEYTFLLKPIAANVL